MLCRGHAAARALPLARGAARRATLRLRARTLAVARRRAAPMATAAAGGGGQPAPAPAPAAAPLPGQPRFCLARNGEALEGAPQQPAGAWLQAAPRGAYTAARTVGGGARVLKLGSHIARLAQSANLMVEADRQARALGRKGGGPAARARVHAHGNGALPAARRPLANAARPPAPRPRAQLVTSSGGGGAAPPPPFTAAALRPRVLQCMGAAIAAFRRGESERAPGAGGGAQQQQQQQQQERAEVRQLRLTVLMTWGGGGGSGGNGNGSGRGPPDFELWCHAEPLPPRPRPPVKLQMRGLPRANARAKDSEWVRQRRVLEATKPDDVNEARACARAEAHARFACRRRSPQRVTGGPAPPRPPRWSSAPARGALWRGSPPTFSRSAPRARS